MPKSPTVFIDADDCPYKEEIYRVAQRHGLQTLVVSNSERKIPRSDLIKSVVVEKKFDAVDDWICERVDEFDVVVTNDLLLSDRVIKKRAKALNTRGREVTPDSIGEALATRELMSQLRQMGEKGSNPKPLGPKEKSEFLNSLDRVVTNAKLRR